MDGIPEQDLITELGPGHHFGLLAFEDLAIGRCANVYAKKTTHLLVISKSAFANMVKFNTKRIINEKISFLKMIPLL